MGVMLSKEMPAVMPQSVLERTVALNPLIPHSPSTRQIRFLELESLDALYGGAAGGGKSDALLMAAVQFAEVEGYSAIIMRRTMPDLRLPGALLDRSREWFHGKGEYNAQEHRWRFPKGSTLQFGFCEHEHDVHRYQSSEYQFIGLDEATQFTPFQIRYLFSRLRKRKAIPVPLRFRLASNPGNISHEFVKARYIDPGEEGKVYIPARLADNPGLDQGSYLRSLMELDPLTRSQLLAGNWNAVEGGRFLPAWFDNRYRQSGDVLTLAKKGDAEGKTVKVSECERFITCDPAASAKKTADYTVAGVWLRTPWNDLVMLDALRFQAALPDIVPRIVGLADKWNVSGVWVEVVAANNGVFELLKVTHLPVRRLDTLGLDKLVRATTAINYAAEGRIWLPAAGVRPGMPLDEIESELYRFTGDDKKDDHDDAVDMVSYACRVVAGGKKTFLVFAGADGRVVS